MTSDEFEHIAIRFVKYMLSKYGYSLNKAIVTDYSSMYIVVASVDIINKNHRFCGWLFIDFYIDKTGRCELSRISPDTFLRRNLNIDGTFDGVECELSNLLEIFGHLLTYEEILIKMDLLGI